MLNFWKKNSLKPARFSFGATSAIITNLAIITGLDSINNAKLSIIGGLLVIAIADNISDTLGIHIYKEAETTNKKEIFLTTFTSYFTRLFISMIFVLIVLIFPLSLAIYLSIIYGFLVLSLISYIIAYQKKINPIKAMLWHITVAFFVIILSSYLGSKISSYFQ